jgi:CheY-like chemotaxis protein
MPQLPRLIDAERGFRLCRVAGAWYTQTIFYPTHPAPVPGATMSTSRSARVLVVDDCRDTVETTVTLLRIHGFRAAGATCWDQAAVGAVSHPPDIALIDLVMPGVDGCEFARRLLATAATSRPPLLIAITGRDTDWDRQRAFAAGFVLYLTKPVPPDELINVIRQCADSRNEASHPAAC